MNRKTLFPTGERPGKKPKPLPPARPTPAPPAVVRAAVGATLADALDGLPADRQAAILAKALFVLRPWELGCVARLVLDLIRVDHVDGRANRGLPG